jgi:hypothetical protein
MGNILPGVGSGLKAGSGVDIVVHLWIELSSDDKQHHEAHHGG